MPRTLPLPKGNEKVWLELLPREHLRKHGRHVYMFRNTQTNQILYTLYPRIEQRTLRQLPFIGKHSVPPRIRPDLWAAHCRVGPFPTQKQGLDALKKLREFRKLHELCWHKTNPDWVKEPKKTLIKSIMDQRKNASADLAKVLSIQAELGEEIEKKRTERKQKQEEYLKKKWARIKELAESAEKGKIKELNKNIRDCKCERGNKLDNPKEVHRLETAMSEFRKQLREIQWAQRMLLARAKDQVQKNEVYFSLLPKALKPLPKPYHLNGVEVQWADLLDAEYAKELWPGGIVHSALPTPKVLTADEFHDRIVEERKTVEEEAKRLLKEMKLNAENERRAAAGLPPLQPEPEPKPEKKGIAKYVPEFIWEMKNPFKRAST